MPVPPGQTTIDAFGPALEAAVQAVLDATDTDKQYDGASDFDVIEASSGFNYDTVIAFRLQLDRLDADQMIVSLPGSGYEDTPSTDGQTGEGIGGFKVFINDAGELMLEMNVEVYAPGLWSLATFGPPPSDGATHSYLCFFDGTTPAAPRLWIDGAEVTATASDVTIGGGTFVSGYPGRACLMARQNGSQVGDSMFTQGTLSGFGVLDGSSWTTSENIALLAAGESPLALPAVDGETVLMTFLDALHDLSGVLIRDGIPDKGEIVGEEWIALLDVDFRQDPHAMNVTTRPRKEEYDQNVLISVVYASSSDQSAVNARAWLLFRAVESAIRSNPTLAGYYTGEGAIISAQIGAGKFSKRATSSERESAIAFSVHVKARL